MKYFRQRMWGTFTMLQTMLMDPECWMNHISLNLTTGVCCPACPRDRPWAPVAPGHSVTNRSPQGSIRMAVHHRRRGVPPLNPPLKTLKNKDMNMNGAAVQRNIRELRPVACDTGGGSPPPDQSDHRAKKRNAQMGKSGRGIFDTQFFWVPSPPLPPPADTSLIHREALRPLTYVARPVPRMGPTGVGGGSGAWVGWWSRRDTGPALWSVIFAAWKLADVVGSWVDSGQPQPKNDLPLPCPCPPENETKQKRIHWPLPPESQRPFPHNRHTSVAIQKESAYLQHGRFLRGGPILHRAGGASYTTRLEGGGPL